MSPNFFGAIPHHIAQLQRVKFQSTLFEKSGYNMYLRNNTEAELK